MKYSHFIVITVSPECAYGFNEEPASDSKSEWARNPNQGKMNTRIERSSVFLIVPDLSRNDWQCLKMDGNYCKVLFKGYKFFQLAKNGWKWLGMAKSVLDIDVNR